MKMLGYLENSTYKIKSSYLPLKVRIDLSFDEAIVIEMTFGKKTNIFLIIYRNTAYKQGIPEFEIFLINLRASLPNSQAGCDSEGHQICSFLDMLG